MNIYHYDAASGCLLSAGVADANPLDEASPLLPAYATPASPPQAGELECVRYLDSASAVPTHYADGEWYIHPDWREVPLWSTQTGAPVEITEPNVTPEQIDATVIPYPGPGYIWHDEQWQADPALQYQLAEQAAEQELAIRQAEASAEIARIQPAVEGGYAKPADIELLPQWQRYRYELPDVREKEGWPESPQWPKKPGTVV